MCYNAAMVSSSVTVMTPVKWVERMDQGSSYTLILYINVHVALIFMM